MTQPVDLSTTLGNAWFPSPLFTASGCASSGKELAQFFPLKDIGAVVTKSVMTKPRHGRPTPRMAETPSGMLNSIGLQGPGIDAFLANDVPCNPMEYKDQVLMLSSPTMFPGCLGKALGSLSPLQGRRLMSTRCLHERFAPHLEYQQSK